jgi:hypothetical protein
MGPVPESDFNGLATHLEGTWEAVKQKWVQMRIEIRETAKAGGAESNLENGRWKVTDYEEAKKWWRPKSGRAQVSVRPDRMSSETTSPRDRLEERASEVGPETKSMVSGNSKESEDSRIGEDSRVNGG